MTSETQGALFELAPRAIDAADMNPERASLAAKLPREVRFGTMTWSFPGWIGLVYARGVSEKHLAPHGLTAYAKHPLLRAVEIDRSYYDPLPARIFRDFAEQVPEDFRFFAKAHEECLHLRFPEHARYGKKRGAPNPRFLDASYAADAVIAPVVDGLGSKLGGILFQFPPQDVGDPRIFAERLHDFLRRLPRGLPYVVELRNEELLTREYAAALADTGAVHCHNVWTSMPTLRAQAQGMPPEVRRPFVVRWLLRQGERYEDASARYAPFDRIVSEDRWNRETIARLVATALRRDVPAFVLVDNKAEGCAPESIALLAQAIAVELDQD
ncbi:MAG TPA: DUF72 domain-containing protein [Polyangiaceae bacterium]|nr:DUF72 domain-containing protein [Polyangiaceae bacterium]